MKARKLRAVGRMLIRGTREELVEALDELIEPKSRLWERVSDIAVGYVVDVLLEGREDLVAGIREVLDELFARSPNEHTADGPEFACFHRSDSCVKR